MSAWHKLESLGRRREPKWENASFHKTSLQARLKYWLTWEPQPIGTGTIPGLVVLGPLRKQTEQASHHQQARKQQPPDFFNDDQRCGSVSQITPSSPKLLWSWYVTAATVTLTKTHILHVASDIIIYLTWWLKKDLKFICYVCVVPAEARKSCQISHGWRYLWELGSWIFCQRSKCS